MRNEHPLCFGPERFASTRLACSCGALVDVTKGSSEFAVISVLLPESFRGGCSFGAVNTVSPDTNLTITNWILGVQY